MIAGGGRYIVVRPGQPEVAFVVVDEYQGRGIGKALMRHLVSIACAAGLQIFIARGTARKHSHATAVQD